MTSKPVRVLVVDDSAFARKVIREVLEGDARFQVVGIARDGLDALEKIRQLEPDVVTLDLAMPDLDGMGVLEALGTSTASVAPRVVVVTTAEDDSDLVVSALQCGAVDLVPKPTALATDRLFDLGDLLRSKVFAAAAARVALPSRASVMRAMAAKVTAPLATCPRIVVIGASTGGPKALTTLLAAIPSGFPVPIAVVLHIPIGYTEALAARLNMACAISVVEASDGIALCPGQAVVARAGTHLKVTAGDPPIGRLDTLPSDHPHRPSVDVLFSSAAAALGDTCIGVVLTGMGDDGLRGARDLRAAGSVVLTEAESSCVVYGMPRSVEAAGLSSAVVRLDRMADAIVQQLALGR